MTTFSNISAMLWWAVLLMEQIVVPRLRKLPTCHKSLTNFIT